MGESRNIGQDNSLVVYGNPESFKKLIKSHGQLCKVKQVIACPCITQNHGSPDYNCTICRGMGYIYTYQRRFLITDEQSLCNIPVTEIYPYYIPILEVIKVERVISEIQGGIQELPVSSFSADTIYVNNTEIEAKDYEKKRVTYYYDGWTYVEGDLLTVDANNGLMWPTQTFYNAGFQSSNPFRAESDIAQVVKIYNYVTGIEVINYEKYGNCISTNETIVSGQMKADYYYSDLTQIINADIKTKDNLEKWANELTSGDVRLALYPWFNISKGDIITMVATVQYKTEMLQHTQEMDRLWEIEIFDINDIILDGSGNVYRKNIDYTLQGNYIKWIGSTPSLNSHISVRYGYKPSFIIFEDNPEPNNLENKQYPKIVFAKSWTKINHDDITKLITG